MIIKSSQKIIFRNLFNSKNFNLYNAINKDNINFSIFFSNSNSKRFSTKVNNVKLLQSPEEIYSTPIYDKQNPEFSETYLNFLFNLNSEELNQTNIDYKKLTDNMITLFKVFPGLENQEDYFNKLDYVIDFLYNNCHKFELKELVKLFNILVEKNTGESNLLLKFNFFISNKLNQAKSSALKEKESFEDFVYVFFNHFHFCAESGISNRSILNNFLNVLSKENYFKNLLVNEANVNNVIYLISLSIANLNEMKKNDLLEKEFLEPEKDLITINNMIILLKLLNITSKNLEINITEKSNSRNRLFKSLKYLKSEGVTIPEKLEEFLQKYDSNEIPKFENKEYEDINLNNKLESLFEKIGIKYEKNKTFDICGVEFYVEPGICLRINYEEDYKCEFLKGKTNFINRYLYLTNYDVINLPYYIFKEEEKLEEFLKKRFYHVINGGYDRISEKNRI